MFKDEFTIRAEDIVLHIKNGHVRIFELINNRLSPSRGEYEIVEKDATARYFEESFCFGDIILRPVGGCDCKVDVVLKIRTLQLLNNYMINKRMYHLIGLNNNFPIKMENVLPDGEKEFEEQQYNYIKRAANKLYGNHETPTIGSK